MSKSHRFPLVQFRENRTRQETPRSLLNHARYDAVDRTVSVTAEDGAATSYVYATAANSSAWSTTVTDAAGKKKIYVTDALGRLITVYEDPNGANYAASYFYDPLGDLTGVVQGYCPGCQSRTLDSLQRLALGNRLNLQTAHSYNV